MDTQLKIALVAASLSAFSALQVKHTTSTTNRKVATFWCAAFVFTFVTAAGAAVWWALL